jgi:hypothetical protein
MNDSGSRKTRAGVYAPGYKDTAGARIVRPRLAMEHVLDPESLKTAKSLPGASTRV